MSGNKPSGFTLIEVLVALAIVGLALAAVAGTFSNGLMGHEIAGNADAALALAEERLTLAGAGVLRPGTGSGNFAGRYDWKTTITLYRDDDRSAKPTLAPAMAQRLYRIAVSVAWRDGRRQRQLALSTLRLGPAISP